MPFLHFLFPLKTNAHVMTSFLSPPVTPNTNAHFLLPFHCGMRLPSVHPSPYPSTHKNPDMGHSKSRHSIPPQKPLEVERRFVRGVSKTRRRPASSNEIVAPAQTGYTPRPSPTGAGTAHMFHNFTHGT